MAIYLHCVCKWWGAEARSHCAAPYSKESLTRQRQTADIGRGRICGVPAVFPRIRSRASSTLIASTNVWDAMGALRPEDSWRLHIVRRRRLLALAEPARRKISAAAGAGRGSVSDHAGRAR